MIEKEIDFSDYHQNELIEHLEEESSSILENQVHLSEESQMEGIALEMTSTFSFIQREKEETDEEEEELFHYSGLQIFTLTCYVSSFCIAIIGLIFLFLQG